MEKVELKRVYFLLGGDQSTWKVQKFFFAIFELKLKLGFQQNEKQLHNEGYFSWTSMMKIDIKMIKLLLYRKK